VNRKQIERASEILKQIKGVEEIMNGCDNFIVRKFYKVFCRWETNPGTATCTMNLRNSEMKPIFTAYIDKLKTELKELGYEDD